MTKDKPILFSGPMVRALLDGTKTQTRRLLPAGLVQTGYLQDRYGERFQATYGVPGVPDKQELTPGRPHPELIIPLLRITIGDRLYVREHWRCEARFDHVPPRDLPAGIPIYYVADPDPRDSEPGCAGRFRQGMHMPRWASRLTLTVTDVRVQRLQEISEEDALAEGIQPVPNGMFGPPTGEGEMIVADNPTEAYMELWNAINGEGSWESDPWVAAYTFTRGVE